MSEKTQGAKSIAEEAFGNERKFKQLIDALSGPSRRDRQNAAAALAFFSKDHPDLMTSHAGALVDALNRPEAQTRWECLDILTLLVDYDSRACDKAIPGAETALFDEGSGPLRLAALRFLCKLGSTTEARSERVWPLIDEAIQCYHGDLEVFRHALRGNGLFYRELVPSGEEGACCPHGVRRLEWPGSAQTARSANSRQRK